MQGGSGCEIVRPDVLSSRYRRFPVGPLGLALWLGALACGGEEPPAPPPAHVGGAACARCHPAEAERWRGSHHDLAMQEAAAGTVLADFDGAVLEQDGQRFEFHKRDGAFRVRTAGADGEAADFEVAYTFGADPLQQYLVPAPGGRLQVLGAAWDTRPAAAGGQRWFFPGEAVPPGDVLHWTGAAGTWNAQCAACHSTHLEKGYALESDTYATTWSDVDVACEACHGPGAAHVAWAEGGGGGADAGLTVDLRNEGEWRFEEQAAIARRAPPRTSRTELDVCARCHARRTPLVADARPGVPFLDAHRPALLEEGLYHADGQILDEVYVWGSFVQSRMYAAGVACSDCHDPHALRIEDPDAACARCHRREVFAAPSHHHHEPDSAGASCVACHMPARTYLGVDDRRDHGFRVPRPDLTLEIGIPNACESCHADRSPAWAAQAVDGAYGAGRAARPSFAWTLHAGRAGIPGAAAGLASLIANDRQPAIARATAVSLLARQLAPDSVESLVAAFEDPRALVRMAAADAALALPPELRRRAAPLLGDPRRAVRIAAAWSLAPLRADLSAPDAAALDAALGEFRAAQAANADTPEAHVSLANLSARLGEDDAARREYGSAIRLRPFFVPAYVHLAELERRAGRDERAVRALRRGLEQVPDSAELHHELGLALARQQRRSEAVAALARAAELAPEDPRYTYVYAIALNDTGASGRALALLTDLHRRFPADPDTLLALATLHRDRGEPGAALPYARTLATLRPLDPRLGALVRELEKEAGDGHPPR